MPSAFAGRSRRAAQQCNGALGKHNGTEEERRDKRSLSTKYSGSVITYTYGYRTGHALLKPQTKKDELGEFKPISPFFLRQFHHFWTHSLKQGSPTTLQLAQQCILDSWRLYLVRAAACAWRQFATVELGTCSCNACAVIDALRCASGVASSGRRVTSGGKLLRGGVI